MQPLKHTNSMKFRICSCWKKNAELERLPFTVLHTPWVFIY